MRASVDLPDPESPTMPIRSPSPTENVTCSRIGLSWPGNVLHMSSTSRSTVTSQLRDLDLIACAGYRRDELARVGVLRVCHDRTCATCGSAATPGSARSTWPSKTGEPCIPLKSRRTRWSRRTRSRASAALRAWPTTRWDSGTSSARPRSRTCWPRTLRPCPFGRYAGFLLVAGRAPVTHLEQLDDETIILDCGEHAVRPNSVVPFSSAVRREALAERAGPMQPSRFLSIQLRISDASNRSIFLSCFLAADEYSTRWLIARAPI